MAVAVVAALAMSAAAGATSNGDACTVSATATFSPTLSLTTGPFGYTLSGTLSGCQAGNAQPGYVSPGTGTLSTPDPATGTGSCATRQDGGTAVIDWTDGHRTVVPFDVVGAGPVDYMTGYVAYSYTSAGGVTYTTTEPATPVNDSMDAALAASPMGGPTACQSGVRSASLMGPLGFGSPY